MLVDKNEFEQLENWMKKVETKGLVRNKIVNDIIAEVFKQVRAKIKSGKSIVEIYNYLIAQRDIFREGDSKLDFWCFNAYEQVRCKIWSIRNKKKELIVTDVI